MKHRILCILLAGAMSASMLAGCSKTEETKKKTKKVKKTSAQTEESEEDPSEDPENSLPSDPSDPGHSGKNGIGSVTDLPADRVILTYEYNNYAWGYSSYTIAILADGRIYGFDNHTVVDTYGAAYDYEDAMRFRIDCVEQARPAGTVDEEWLQKIYETCEQVDPDAPVTYEDTMCDYGQEAIYYWNEKGERIRLYEYGDRTYTIDDPYAQKAEKLWEELDTHLTVDPDYEELKVYTNLEILMKTYNCGYVDLPQGSSGKYFFTNYEEFQKAAEEWHLDLSAIEEDLFPDENRKELPVFVQFDLFSTTGHYREYDALMIENGVFYLLPAETCHDPDSNDMVGQAMDGYVTIFLYSRDFDATQKNVPAIGGQTWEKYEG